MGYQRRVHGGDEIVYSFSTWYSYLNKCESTLCFHYSEHEFVNQCLTHNQQLLIIK